MIDHHDIDEMLKFFSYDHLRDENMRETSRMFSTVAWELSTTVKPSRQLLLSLESLLVAKDRAVCAVLQQTPRSLPEQTTLDTMTTNQTPTETFVREFADASGRILGAFTAQAVPEAPSLAMKLPETVSAPQKTMCVDTHPMYGRCQRLSHHKGMHYDIAIHRSDGSESTSPGSHSWPSAHH